MCLQIACQRLWTKSSWCYIAKGHGIWSSEHWTKIWLGQLGLGCRCPGHQLRLEGPQAWLWAFPRLSHPKWGAPFSPTFSRISPPSNPRDLPQTKARLKSSRFKLPSFFISPLALAQRGFWQMSTVISKLPLLLLSFGPLPHPFPETVLAEWSPSC